MGWGAIPDDHRLMAGMAGLQTAQRYGNANLLARSIPFNAEADSLNAAILGPDATPDTPEFEAFVADSVEAQRQEGFSTVQIKVIRGDLTPEQFRGLAQLMRDYSGGYCRTTVHQNRTGPAVAHVADFLGAGQMELVAQGVE